jgi:hypothetical protein
MKSRKLRITWSVFWGVGAVLLMVSWVRSYRCEDVLGWVQGSARNLFAVGSMYGTIAFSFQPGGDAEEQLLPQFCRVQRPLDPSLKSIKSFALDANANITSIRFPIWLLIALVTAIGTVAWLRFSWRFSLRRLIIATTLVAIALGAIVLAIRK